MPKKKPSISYLSSSNECQLRHIDKLNLRKICHGYNASFSETVKNGNVKLNFLRQDRKFQQLTNYHMVIDIFHPYPPSPNRKRIKL